MTVDLDARVRRHIYRTFVDSGASPTAQETASLGLMGDFWQLT
jgi:hypothetical protein